VLARGGSAIDAAIAANAVLGVVEPMSCGMGGDLFAIYWDAKTRKLTGINASGWAPKALTAEFLRQKDHRVMPDAGIHSVTVPGCVDGWEKLHKRFGKRPWAELFRPAIYYAEKGFPLTEIIQDHWKTNISKLAAEDYSARVFLQDGRAPRIGEIVTNADHAQALQLVATGGAAAFYRGPIAKAILRTSDKLGGVMQSADLEEFSSEWVDPIWTEYRGWKVYELPPNGQGIATLQMLNMMERYPLDRYGPASPEALHVKIEAQKLAYQDLAQYMADPRYSKVPVEGLLSRRYAEERARLIETDRARCVTRPGNPPATRGDTVYLAVVDKEGNIASFIQSVYLSFGSGIVVDGMGFHLHNRAGLFVLEDGHANVLAGRKRPFHTILPGFMEKGDLHIGFGIMGGLNQAQAHAQFVSNVVDHDMNIQAAMEAPRFTKLNFSGCDVMIESRIPEDARRALRDKGHQLDVLSEYSGRVGGGQAVLHDSASKVNYGASDARKDGAAIPEPDLYFADRTPAPARKSR
jgi:gamma-glutamyltranspeptidase/glutathione hydrolase